MKATQRLHDLGQSIWLDNITRDLQTGEQVKAEGTPDWRIIPELEGKAQPKLTHDSSTNTLIKYRKFKENV